MPTPDLRGAQAFLFDMDGVLYRGEQPIPGARETLATLRERGLPSLFLTNNSSRTPAQYAATLEHMGIHAAPDQVLTSAQVAVDDLQRTATSGDRVLVLGGDGIRAALAESTLQTAPRWEDATIVLVGLDRDLTYEKLAQAALAIGHGARFLATNVDRSYPSERGLEPGGGALVAALEATTGVAPKSYGKPEPAMFAKALAILGMPPARTVMVGDRHATDIAGAARAGLVTVAVLTGVDDEATLRRGTPPPDHVLPSVAEIPQLL